MLFESWGRWFPKFSWLCVEGWIQLDVGFASLGEILCFPCIPNTWLHNQKVSGVYKWEFKYIVGYLSNRHMIRYGVYHMFVFGLFCKPILCFVLICGIRVASKSNVDSMSLSKWCSHISMGILILHDNRDCHVNPFQLVCFSSSGSDHFNIHKINSKSSQRYLFHRSQVAFVFPPSHPFCFSSRTKIS